MRSRRSCVTNVIISGYDPEWPELFESEASRIAALLGDRALRIEHVGSTSVPGLPAKAVIDILLVVSNSANEDSYIPLLEKGGYILRVREPEWYEHRMFNGPDTPVNVHAFSRGCEEIDRMLLFRDWLRQNPADRDLYASAKLALAQSEWQNVDEYAQAKTAIIQEILERATRKTTASPTSTTGRL